MAIVSSTLTFLYTDVEGNTLLWEQQPDAMAAAIARQDAIVRGAIASQGGNVFRATGDGLCAAFTTAAPAAAAAAVAQQALYAEQWPLDRPLRVRIALHSTEAEPQHGDYISSGLNRLGRLLAVCHGGQILLTQTTEQLVRDHLPAGAHLRDLGLHRFRDLIQPDRIYQLIPGGLSADFPPLKSQEARPNNLPVQLTSFVGREREVGQIVALLDPSPAATSGHPTRLLTLTGPGGTGKTRLSLQAAGALLDGFPDGVWFVELAPLADPALVAQAVASSLGLREIAGRPLDAMLGDYLHDKRLLVVLDNCEHLIDECARLASRLLRACPGLVILASSRESLGIAGETVFRVPSLSIPDVQKLPPLDELAHFEAIELFAQRAAGVQPGFLLTSQNAPAVAQIACRLDGIPLALELAAARIRSMSPEQIAARLDDRFRLLTGGSRVAVQRQQTLQALIDWSYDLLSRPECTLLRRLAVFAGGWTLEAAEGVCAWGEMDALDVLDLLDQLANKSLISAETGTDQPRYAMQETVRQYAQDKLLAAGEAVDARARHLAWFAAEMSEGAQEWRTTRRSWRRRWVRQERDNLRSAMEWALETDLEAALALVYNVAPYWMHVGSATEGRRITVRGLARAAAAGWESPDTAPHRQLLLADAWVADGFLAFGSGHNAEARRSYEQAIPLLRLLGENQRLSLACGFAGMSALLGGDVEVGLAYGREALALARQAGDPYGEAMQLISFSRIDRFDVAVRAEDAFARWEEGMAILRELNDSEGEAMGHMAAGNAYLRSGDLNAAQYHLERSAALFEEEEYAYMANVGRSGLADIARLQGDFVRAHALYAPVIRVWRLADHRGALARCFECLGFMAVNQATQTAEPLPLLRRAATLFGAADAIRRANAMPMNRWEQIEHDRHVQSVRESLDPDQLAAAWQAGQRMSVDQAVAYAT